MFSGLVTSDWIKSIQVPVCTSKMVVNSSIHLVEPSDVDPGSSYRKRMVSGKGINL